MDKFLYHTDTLGLLIERNCQLLYQKMALLRVDDLGLSAHGTAYFSGSHLKRLFFSIQTSAHILYNAVQLVQKPIQQIVLMDYGAGVGSLYLLAKMSGCKMVIYNDILAEWKQNALLIAAEVAIDVDRYIVGDIEATLVQLKQEGIQCDVITSRNVLEHIYDLPSFFTCIATYQPNAIVYSSTTANFYNPAMHLQHVFLHKRIEKIYFQQRFNFIQSIAPQLPQKVQLHLAKGTRGYEQKGIQVCVSSYCTSGVLPKPKHFYTNTCDVTWGVWAENLLTFAHYRVACRNAQMQVQFAPGFWDTHYKEPVKRVIGYFFNFLLRFFGKKIGFVFAPFIYVVATPNSRHTQVANAS